MNALIFCVNRRVNISSIIRFFVACLAFQVCLVVSLKSMAMPLSAAPSLMAESNQWVFDKPTGFLQFGVENTNSFTKNFQTDRFRDEFDLNRWSQFEFEALNRFADYKYASLWYDYAVGILQKTGLVYDLNNKMYLSSESASLFSLPIKLGAEAQAEFSKWFLPSVGYLIGFENFRVSSSMSGAEAVGNFSYSGPFVRLKLVIPSTHFAVSSEWAHKTFLAGDKQYFNASDDYTLGVGWLY